MRRITIAIAVLTAVCSTLLSVATASPAAAQMSDPVPWCNAGPAPCIVSAERNGVAVTSTDPTWQLSASASTVGGSERLFWNVERVGQGFDLGAAALSDRWVIVFDVGMLEPRIAFVRGTPGSVALDAGTRRVTVTAMPALQTTDDCSSVGGTLECSEVPGREWEAYLGGDFSDAGAWTDPVERAAFAGTDIFTNISYLNDTPVIGTDPTTGEAVVSLELGNSHFRLDGTTVFEGFIRHVVPAGFLAAVYGIDDPATLRSGGIVTDLGGPGAGTLAVSSSSDGIVIEGSGITFSAREIEIRAGRVTPLRPRNVRVAAASERRARIAFGRAQARGSAVDFHIVRCKERRGTDIERRRTTTRRVVVRGLEPGRAYTCRVRAVSSAGAGRWSAPVRIRATR